MAKIRTVMVASDFSPVSAAAFERAVALAKTNRAKLLVMHAVMLSTPPRTANTSRRRPGMGSRRLCTRRRGSRSGRWWRRPGGRASAPRAWSWPEARMRSSCGRPGRSARTSSCSARTAAPGCRASSWAAWRHASSRPRPARCSRFGDGSSDYPVRPADHRGRRSPRRRFPRRRAPEHDRHDRMHAREPEPPAFEGVLGGPRPRSGWPASTSSWRSSTWCPASRSTAAASCARRCGTSPGAS